MATVPARAVAFGKVSRHSRSQGPASGDHEQTGARQSAVPLIPAPEAETLVGDWRAVHDPSARRGVPAHVTLVVPWVPPEQIKQEHLDELAELLADQEPFEYTLEKVCWFGERVLWLGPSPAAPFQAPDFAPSQPLRHPPLAGRVRRGSAAPDRWPGRPRPGVHTLRRRLRTWCPGSLCVAGPPKWT